MGVVYGHYVITTTTACALCSRIPWAAAGNSGDMFVRIVPFRNEALCLSHSGELALRLTQISQGAADSRGPFRMGRVRSA